MGLPNSSRRASDIVVTGFHSAIVFEHAGQGVDGHEGARDERDREDHHEGHALHRLGRGQQAAQQDADPDDREREGDHQQVGAGGLVHRRVDPPAHDQAADRHQRRSAAGCAAGWRWRGRPAPTRGPWAASGSGRSRRWCGRGPGRSPRRRRRRRWSGRRCRPSGTPRSRRRGRRWRPRRRRRTAARTSRAAGSRRRAPRAGAACAAARAWRRPRCRRATLPRRGAGTGTRVLIGRPPRGSRRRWARRSA